MKKFFADRIAWILALVGVVLMIFTLVWRINPVEGSVVPRFLTDNPLGGVVFWVLFVTCMPAWIGVLLLGNALGENTLDAFLQWLPQWVDRFALLALLLQAITYFLLGKLISVGWHKWARHHKVKAA